MKRILFMFMVIILGLTLVACNNDDDSQTDDKKENETVNEVDEKEDVFTWKRYTIDSQCTDYEFCDYVNDLLVAVDGYAKAFRDRQNSVYDVSRKKVDELCQIHLSDYVEHCDKGTLQYDEEGDIHIDLLGRNAFYPNDNVSYNYEKASYRIEYDELNEIDLLNEEVMIQVKEYNKEKGTITYNICWVEFIKNKIVSYK